MPPGRVFYDQERLDRFRPVLRFDRQYDYRGLAAQSMVENPGNLLRRRDGDVVARQGGRPALTLELLCDDYPGGLPREATDCLAAAPDHRGDATRMEGEPAYSERLYGRCVEDGGRVWLQYWLWLYYNPKNLFGFGKHEGDWEMVQIGLGADGTPEVASYAQHGHGEARAADDVEWEDGRPVVYVAPLSHAAYFEARTHPYLVGIDHPYGDGPRAAPPVVPFGAWCDWPGRWGTTERSFAFGLGDGPPSPGRQGPKWHAPAAWHAALRRRRLRVWLGGVVWRIGRLSYPREPVVLEAVRQGEAVRIRYRLGARSRHLHLSVHAGERVLERRSVRRAAHEGEELLLIPGAPAEGLTVWASAWNGLRQRSDLAAAPVA